MFSVSLFLLHVDITLKGWIHFTISESSFFDSVDLIMYVETHSKREEKSFINQSIFEQTHSTRAWKLTIRLRNLGCFVYNDS